MDKKEQGAGNQATFCFRDCSLMIAVGQPGIPMPITTKSHTIMEERSCSIKRDDDGAEKCLRAVS